MRFLKAQHSEIAYRIRSTVVIQTCLFGKLGNEDSVTLKGGVELIGKTAGGIGIGAAFAADAAFVGKQQEGRCEPDTYAVAKGLELAMTSAHALKVKGVLQLIDSGENQRVFKGKTLNAAFLKAAHSGRAGPAFSVTVAHIALAYLPYLFGEGNIRRGHNSPCACTCGADYFFNYRLPHNAPPMGLSYLKGARLARGESIVPFYPDCG